MKTGDKVKVIADWLPPKAKGARATIQSHQMHGEKFYVVSWKHSMNCGVLFAAHELRAI